MSNYRIIVASLAIAISMGSLLAQPAESSSGGEARAEGDRILGEMATMQSRVLQLQRTAREAKDVVKLNCINEKLIAVKALLNTAENEKRDLDDASDSTQAQYLARLREIYAEATTERDGAHACMGEDLTAENSRVTVQRPAMPDDPTDDPSPFEPTTPNTVDLERPAFATPF